MHTFAVDITASEITATDTGSKAVITQLDKGSAPSRSNSLFLVFAIRALWRSDG